MSFGIWIQDEQEFAVERKLERSLYHDNVDSFRRTVQRLDSGSSLLRGQEFLMKACKYNAVRCASVLLNGETPLIFDVNRPTHLGIFPIHLAASHCWAGMIELLLCHGARTDVQCSCTIRDRSPHLPLHAALDVSSNGFGVYVWFPGDSIFKLVTIFCLDNYRRILESVELLAWNTNKVEDEFLRYAKEGKVSFLAPLLAVARRRLTSAISTIRQSLSSDTSDPLISKDKKEEITLLLNVFQRAGNALERYRKKNKNGVTVKQVCADIACLLRDAGFHTNATDTDLSSLFSEEMEMNGNGFTKPILITEDKDVGMEHYGKSGHRWMICNTPSTGRDTASSKPNKPSRRYEITEEQKLQIPTAVGKVLPIPIPCLVDCGYTAAQFIDAYKHKGRSAGVAQNEHKSNATNRKPYQFAQGQVWRIGNVWHEKEHGMRRSKPIP